MTRFAFVSSFTNVHFEVRSNYKQIKSFPSSVRTSAISRWKYPTLSVLKRRWVARLPRRICDQT